MTAKITQLHMLEIVPDAFVRIQLRRIARQLDQVQPLRAAVTQEVFDNLTTVHGQAIPHDQQLPGDVMQQMFQEMGAYVRTEPGSRNLVRRARHRVVHALHPMVMLHTADAVRAPLKSTDTES